ncbi:hypothetical protein ONZ45_g5797 [Pleurotus djamor]|nr:hypothetical protein ONZ45_g5797 [Pleurotus djamor]
MPFDNQGNTHIHGNYNDVAGDQSNNWFNMIFNVVTAAQILVPSVSKHASFDATPRQHCAPQTRVKLLEEIKVWAMNPSTSKPVYWLHGAAGLGKTAIAQSFAEECATSGSLGASFFFSKSDKERNDVRKLFATIAYQLCMGSPEHDYRTRCVLDKDPKAVYALPEKQLEKLIIEPLADENEYQIVVIDSLDECDDQDALEAILPLLIQAVSKTHLRFLITSRLTTFFASLFQESIEEIEPIDLYNHDAKEDIRVFYDLSLKKMAKDRQMDEHWFTPSELDRLVNGSGNLFLYASTVVGFINSTRQRNPRAQLKAALSVEPNQADGIYGRLDALYRGILANIPQDAYRSLTSRVIGTVCLSLYPLPPASLDGLLGLGRGDAWQCLQDLLAFFQVPDKADEEKECVRLSHSFFREFITIPSRSKAYTINFEAHHAYLLCKCLDLMLASLKKNILELPGDGDIATWKPDQIAERVSKKIGSVLEYASRSWYYHLKNALITEEVIRRLEMFMERTIFYWTEFMSATIRMDEVLAVLNALCQLANRSELLGKRAKGFNDVVTKDMVRIRRWPLNVYTRIAPQPPPVLPVRPPPPPPPVVPIVPLRPHSPDPPAYPLTPNSVEAPTTTPNPIRFPEPYFYPDSNSPNTDTISLSDSLRNCELLKSPPSGKRYLEPQVPPAHSFAEDTTCAFCMEDSGNIIVLCVSMEDGPVTICEDCLSVVNVVGL